VVADKGEVEDDADDAVVIEREGERADGRDDAAVDPDDDEDMLR
jgi:hypothetical protein